MLASGLVCLLLITRLVTQLKCSISQCHDKKIVENYDKMKYKKYQNPIDIKIVERGKTDTRGGLPLSHTNTLSLLGTGTSIEIMEFCLVLITGMYLT